MPPVARKADLPILHFVEDGFTAAGRVWFSGDELEYDPESDAYKKTVDRRGFTWLSLVGKDREQVNRYGKVYFKPGPYTGPKFADMDVWELMEAQKSNNPIVPTTKENAEYAESQRRRVLA